MILFNTYFTLQDWFGIIILGGLIAFGIITLIINAITNLWNHIFKKNCFDCKHWHLGNVASYGDGCEYCCLKRKEISTFNRYHHMISMNKRKFYTKCDQFESKYNKENGSEQQDN